MGEEGATMAVMGAHQPQHQLRILRLVETRHERRESYRQSLVPPMLRESGVSSGIARQGASRLGENLSGTIRVQSQRIAIGQPRLKSRIGLAGIMEVACQLQVQNALFKQASLPGEPLCHLFYVGAVLLK